MTEPYQRIAPRPARPVSQALLGVSVGEEVADAADARGIQAAEPIGVLGGDIDERHNDKGPHPHARMRNNEVGFVDNLVTHKQDVGVERARTPRLSSHAAGGVLEGAAHLEQSAGAACRLQGHDHVEVWPLAGWASNRVGLVNR